MVRTQRRLILCLLCWVPVSLAQPPWPAPVVPDDNPHSPAKLALGERLFAEPGLSVTGQYSCASCHQPDRHFTDGRPTAIGATGQPHPRNTPTLYNVAYHTSFGWDDQGVHSLEAQHRIPLLNTRPVEMGFSEALLNKLLARPDYAALWAQAFPQQSPGLQHVTQAIATYVRTLRHPPNAFDDYVYWDKPDALSPAARAGLALFFSPRLGCGGCHSGFTLSGPIRYQGGDNSAQPEFSATGINAAQAFRAPTLRAVAYTAPYMHNGSLATLEQVIQHYETSTAPDLHRFTLSRLERQQLLEFLRSL